jgi:hypothetical protein
VRGEDADTFRGQAEKGGLERVGEGHALQSAEDLILLGTALDTVTRKRALTGGWYEMITEHEGSASASLHTAVVRLTCLSAAATSEREIGRLDG